jgi:undecaprenyl-diphosphatase
MEIIQQVDLWILNFINLHLHNFIAGQVMIFCSKLGNWGSIWLVMAVVLLFNKKYRRFGIMALCVLLLSTLMAETVLKPLIARPRPFIADPSLSLLIAAPHGFSFPSSHAMSAFAAATIFYHANRRLGNWAYLLAILIAFSRLYLNLHYPSDIICGAIFGALLALLVLARGKGIFTRRRK